MFIVEIQPNDYTAAKTFTDRSTGLSRLGNAQQKAYLHHGAGYPLPFKIRLPHDQAPPQPGFYSLGGDAFKIGQYGLDFDDRNIELVPIADAVAFAQSFTDKKLKAAS